MTIIFIHIFQGLVYVAVKIGTYGDAHHTGEEIQGTRVPNSCRGTRKSTRLTSKYVLPEKKCENNYKAVEMITFFGELSLRR